MSVLEESTKLDKNIISTLVTTGAGYDIMRYQTLPDFLGQDAPYLLYLMGKNMARKTTIQNYEELYEFFQYMGWGDLSLVKEKKKELVFKLTGHIIEKRLSQNLFPIDYRVECGFLAETVQTLTGQTYECLEEKYSKEKYIELTAMIT
ncbi:YslB family protein [Halobacillus sp. K22]|uniref:YslB family protein n=1 Tax=Halobacillus sp. K22 TaxID=3457431 RepID=UPI003FCCD141